MTPTKRHKYLVLLVASVALLIGATESYAQSGDEGWLDFYCYVFEYPNQKKPLKDVKVDVFAGDKRMMQSQFTKSSGQFMISFDYQKDITIRFSKAGYVDMYAEINTTVGQRDATRIEEFKLNVPVFKSSDTTINPAAFDQMPFVRLQYGRHGFEENAGHYEQFLAVLDSKPATSTDPIVEASTPADSATVEHTPLEEGSIATDSSSTAMNADENALGEQAEEPGREGPADNPEPTMEVAFETPEMEHQAEKNAREEEIAENLEIKRDHERELQEIVVESETGKPIGLSAEAQYHASEAVPDEVRVARADAADAKRERERQIRENKATKSQMELELLADLAEAERQRLRQLAEQTGTSTEARVKPKLEEKILEDRFETTTFTTVYYPGQSIAFKKRVTLWGQTYYYRNEEEITEGQYTREIEKYKALQ